MIQVELLGTIKVLRDGTPFRMERRAQRLLMGLLALDAGQLVSSSYLIEMLWGAHSPASARATLHSRISELRSLFNRQSHGDGAVELRSVGVGYCLDIAPENVDSHRFLELVGGWRQLPTATAAVERLSQALNLWRGPVFGGLAPEATPLALEALTAAKLTAVEDYFMLNLHLGNYGQVVDRLTEAAGANPTRERLIAQCMHALYRCGRAAEALTMYANWRAWLHDTLGTDPSAEVQQVYLSIVRNEDPAPLGVLPFPGRIEPERIAITAQPVLALETVPSASHKPALSPPTTTTPPTQPTTTPPTTTPPTTTQPTTTPSMPCTLPPPVDGFIGRETETADLVELINAGERLIAVSGPAGVGKTALTVHVAHQVADRFPDGQLFADLHGFDEELPEETADRILGRFLRTLGEPSPSQPSTSPLQPSTSPVQPSTSLPPSSGAPPQQFGERIDRYRQLLAGRRMLVILDNVASDDQIAPLLSAGGSCQVIVNGRTRLGAGSGAQHLGLQTMPDGQARQLLKHLAGERVDGDPQAAGEVIRHCGNLPLAIRIAGAKLATKPHWSLAHLGRLLAVDRTRLLHLTHQEMSVAARIRQSYRRVSPPAQRLLVAMSTLDVPAVPVWMAAALLDVDSASAERLLEELFDANLAEVWGKAFHFRLGDLVRDYGRGLAESSSEWSDLRGARRRAYAACLSLVEAAHRRMTGSDYVRGDALRWSIDEHLVNDVLTDPATWFDHEFSVITSVVTMAAADGWVEECWEIAGTASAFFRIHGYLSEWTNMLATALDATEHSGLERGQAVLHHRGGQLRADRGEHARSRADFERSGDLFARCADAHGSALAEMGLAELALSAGDLDGAMRRYRDLRRHLATVGDAGAASEVLRTIGQIHVQRLEYGPARQCFTAALRAFEDIGSAYGRSQVLECTSRMLLDTGETARAYQGFREALAAFRTFGDRAGIVACLRGAALAARAMGDIDAARSLLDELSTGERLARPFVVTARKPPTDPSTEPSTQPLTAPLTQPLTEPYDWTVTDVGTVLIGTRT